MRSTTAALLVLCGSFGQAARLGTRPAVRRHVLVPLVPELRCAVTTMCSSETAEELSPEENSGVQSSQEESSAEYRVYLLDDHFNMREYVSRVLMMVCEISEDRATDVMMQANWGGSALIGSWEQPIAEHIYAGMKQAGLEAELLPPDDDRKSTLPDGDGEYFRW